MPEPTINTDALVFELAAVLAELVEGLTGIGQAFAAGDIPRAMTAVEHVDQVARVDVPGALRNFHQWVEQDCTPEPDVANPGQLDLPGLAP